VLPSVHPRTGAPIELCCRINGSLPAASLAAVWIPDIVRKADDARDFRGLSPGLLRGVAIEMRCKHGVARDIRGIWRGNTGELH